MEVSVIIPTFNRAESVCAAIASVIGQTLAPKEIIVVDDGSSDDTVSKVAAQFPNVTLLTGANKGVSAARNKGIAKAATEWVAFLDSDDSWLANKLAKQALASNTDPRLNIIHTDEIWVRNGVRVNPMNKHQKPTGWVYEHCLPLCCVSPSSVAIRQAVFEQVGFFDEALPACEDYDMWLRLFSRHPVHLVDEALLVKTGGHPDQLSKKYWGMDRFRVIALDKILQSAVLNQAQTEMTVAALKHKCDVLIKGGLKQGNIELVEAHQALAAKYSGTI